MKKIITTFSSITLISLLFISCEIGNFNLQDDPDYLDINSANPEYLLNEVQYLFKEIVEDLGVHTDDIMRYESLSYEYPDIVDADVLDTQWERYYEALNNSRAIEVIAESDQTLLFHNAVNKLLLGYLTVTLVDYIGGIPYSEAVDNATYPNPNVDDGAELYKIVLADIDQAITNIEDATFEISTDLFYDSNKTRWIAFAKSLKLRLLIQTRLASSEIGITDLKTEINTLLGEDIISVASEDFQYRYGTTMEPESRHRYFISAYDNGFSGHMGNYFMWMLKDSKNVADPRIRYYLYRQSDVDPFSGPPYVACQYDTNADYCYIGEHYWGLDHGDNRDGRGDNLLKTVYGIYPGGGTFDEDQFTDAPSQSNHLGGAGILPIITSSYMKFLIAEAALVLGTDGNPVDLLEDAIRDSMDKVLSFGSVTSAMAATQSDVDDYVDEVITNYNAATTDEEKLDIIITEFYMAGYGNSIEAYNAYRRTGYPSNIQTHINNDNPVFPRTYPYSENEVDRNNSIEQKPNTVQVFWDTNPAGFIK
ncbi:hypothetical protein APS56_08930 [Pseudalgibacter alginicilyticus]|uniref:SusD/RagB family nutrient-binding outer membrane lipoprotein n=1 Tax=Pseudalgibacter alginicilyticus TaxID=1736674 RepID=A0A0P0DBD7_9FLAO|nr:SusD/RagB family nutrient-binding outer membrane lipoprotein [Pseudalgibacter alginicilyticus]ALJ05240.1 hypothetical protein APS56_08930 [Pseudalgibacter alginicilyticus]